MLGAGIPKAYIRFGIFDYLNTYCGEKTILNSMICGGIAGGVEGLFIHVPIENMKIKLINDKMLPQPKYRSTFHGMKSIIQKRGFEGITRGALPNTMKECSNHAFRFTIFMILQSLMTPYIENQILRDISTGLATGLCSAALNQPLDVIKTNLQGLKAHKYNGMKDCAQKIYRLEGAKGFYKGLHARMIRVGIEVSVTFASYGIIKDAVLKYSNTV